MPERDSDLRSELSTLLDVAVSALTILDADTLEQLRRRAEILAGYAQLHPGILAKALAAKRDRSLIDAKIDQLRILCDASVENLAALERAEASPTGVSPGGGFFEHLGLYDEHNQRPRGSKAQQDTRGAKHS